MIQEISHNQYCQSCGMPLRFDVEEYLGTNTDRSRSDEFCYYCLKDGEYTVDIPLEEMVDIWVKYTDKYNEYSSTNYTPQELRTLLNKRLPTLKRWKQKETTRNIHIEALNKIKVYIDKNLHKEIAVGELSSIANLSVFHFRRIFKNITGENIGNYIQRIRLQQVAHILISTDFSVNEILKQTNYQTKHSLAKVFKQHFGMPMSAYRERYKFIPIEEVWTKTWKPEIKKLCAQQVVCYPVDNASLDMDKYSKAWRKIIHYKERHLPDEKNSHFISISLDNPLVTSQNQCRFYLGVSTSRKIKSKGMFFAEEIPGGIYAVFRYKGNYASLPELYRFICEKWLPENGYYQKYPMSFERYLNLPRDVEVSELLTEVYIPIDKQ